jgi:uncharacterized protein YqjF (DUF2071 family)
MFSSLHNHPFAVEAHFERSIVLTFALPKEQLAPLLPTCLSLDLFQDKWAFLAVAMVQTKHLRPKGFPKLLGNDFFLIGYRIFVRYTNLSGKKLRGLYILSSATDQKKMQLLGNIFTHYQYTTTDIKYARIGSHTIISSVKSGFNIDIDDAAIDIALPLASPFGGWAEARKFAGPLPFTFTYLARENKILIVEGVRQHWVPDPIHIADYNFRFLKDLNLQSAVLANAFQIFDVPYFWKKGKTEIIRS